MAREARHSSCSPEFDVRVAHQLNHLARGLLRRLVVLIELVLDVAKGAVDSKRGFEREHYFHQSIGGNSFEQLNVLVLLLGALFFAARRQRIQ